MNENLALGDIPVTETFKPKSYWCDDLPMTEYSIDELMAMGRIDQRINEDQYGRHITFSFESFDGSIKFSKTKYFANPIPEVRTPYTVIYEPMSGTTTPKDYSGSVGKDISQDSYWSSEPIHISGV